MIHLFFFPFNFEGLPIVLVEGQINGLRVVKANHLPVAKILENYGNSLCLKDQWNLWADMILSVRDGRTLDREYVYKNISASGFEKNLRLGS